MAKIIYFLIYWYIFNFNYFKLQAVTFIKLLKIVRLVKMMKYIKWIVNFEVWSFVMNTILFNPIL